jgi:hypothetical protein
MWSEVLLFKNLSIFVVIVLLHMSTGCKNEITEASLDARHESGQNDYEAEPKAITGKDIRVTVKAEHDFNKGELLLIINIQNNSDEDISVDYMNCALKIDEERTAVPRVLRSYKSTITSADEETYEIYFYPINTLDFFNNTDYFGDMKQQYKLDLDFVADTRGNRLLNDQIVLTLPDTAYQDYLQQYARERFMDIYCFDFDRAAFETSEAQHLHKISFINNTFGELKDVPAIYALNPSITINRMIFNVFSYKEKDTLIVNMRMLNEDSHPLKVIPSRCVVKISNASYKPVNIFSDTFENGRFPDDAYIFSPGTRLHLKLKYVIPNQTDKWSLSSDWLLISTDPQEHSWKKLIFTDVTFNKSPVAKDAH